MIDSWKSAWTGSPSDKASRLFGVATLAAGGSEGASNHMAGLRWSQSGNYGRWPNPAMPNTFGAQLYDLGDPWSSAGDGNRPIINQSNGQPAQPITRSCCLAPQKAFNWTGDGPGCPNVNATEPFMRKACYDKFGCALPDPITGKYGPLCAKFDLASWPAEMQSVAKLVQQNAPSGEPGVNFMGEDLDTRRSPGTRISNSLAQTLAPRSQRAFFSFRTCSAPPAAHPPRRTVWLTRSCFPAVALAPSQAASIRASSVSWDAGWHTPRPDSSRSNSGSGTERMAAEMMRRTGR